MKNRFIYAALAGLLGMALNVSVPLAAEVTLKGISALPQGMIFSRTFERMVAKVNAEGKGILRINYLGGGGKVMNPFEVGNALRTGVVHIASVPGAFYTNLMPEADAFKLSQRSPQELRKMGAWKFLNKLHADKMNAYYLARQGAGIPFHLYLTKPIDKPDLSGLRIRVTPVYRAFFVKLGAIVVRTKPGDVYTSLERGAVDGYGWPVQGVKEMGWHEVTKYRVDPGFYNAEVNILVNLDQWKRLNGQQQAFLKKIATWVEALNFDNLDINREEKRVQSQSGIKTITFAPEVARKYLKTAYDSGWEQVHKVAPKNAPILEKYFRK